MSKNQVEEIIDQANSFETQLMIMTMVSTGMRVSELLILKPNWKNEKDKLIHIQNNEVPLFWKPKRDFQRRIPIGNDLLNNLKRYLGNRKKEMLKTFI